MTRNNDKIEALEEYVNEKRIEDGIRAGITKWAHTICITATSAIMTALYNLGSWAYENSGPLQAAFKAFQEAVKK